MLLVKDMKKDADKVPVLRAAGFDVSEVASMLGVKESYVWVAHHRGRKKKAS
jgi:DNA-directed RNA polymerase specialized sigma24 family protein